MRNDSANDIICKDTLIVSPISSYGKTGWIDRVQFAKNSLPNQAVNSLDQQYYTQSMDGKFNFVLSVPVPV